MGRHFPDGCALFTFLAFGCFFSVGALSGLIAGPVQLVQGQDKLDEASKADPDKDFADLGKVCNVTDVKHCWETKERRARQCNRWGSNCRDRDQEYCEDTYTYDFKVDVALVTTGGLLNLLDQSSGGEYKPLLYTSKEESNERDRDDDDDDDDEWEQSCRQAGGDSNEGCHDGDWRTDDADGTNGPAFHSFKPLDGLVQCWAPRDGMDEKSLPSVYVCGNEACVKIFNPADEKSNKKDEADRLIIAGYICLGAGGLCLVLAILMFCCASKQAAAAKRAKARHVTAQPAMPTAVAQPAMPTAVAQPVVMPMAQPVAVPVANAPHPTYPPQPVTVTVA